MNITKYETKIEKENFAEIDCQDRSQLVSNLHNLVKYSQSSLVISVEAPWGYGKTFFAKYCESEFKKEGEYSVYFNAWENDYSEDPFIVFYDELLKIIEKKKIADNKFEEIFNKYKKFGTKILEYSIPLIVTIISRGLIDSSKLCKQLKGLIKGDDISPILQKFAEDQVAVYKKKQESIAEFKEILTEFVEKIQNNGEEKRTITIFVDELDRCRPNYAIELIENVKHLFNVKGINFILFLDIAQLKASIQTLYGENMDAEGYLKRFFDYRILLPTPKIEAFCRYLNDKYGFEENDLIVINKNEKIIDWIIFLINPYETSLRDLEKIFFEINILFTTIPNIYVENLPLLLLLIILKHKDPGQYRLIHKNKYDLSNLDRIFGVSDEQHEYLRSNKKWISIRSILMFDFMELEELNYEFERVKNVREHQNDNLLKRNADLLIRRVEDFNYGEYKGYVAQLLRKIDYLDKIFIND